MIKTICGGKKKKQKYLQISKFLNQLKNFGYLLKCITDHTYFNMCKCFSLFRLLFGCISIIGS